MSNPLEPLKPSKKPWELLFDPDLFEEEHGDLRMQDFALDEDTLKSWAVDCSRIRAEYR